RCGPAWTGWCQVALLSWSTPWLLALSCATGARAVDPAGEGEGVPVFHISRAGSVGPAPTPAALPVRSDGDGSTVRPVTSMAPPPGPELAAPGCALTPGAAGRGSTPRPTPEVLSKFSRFVDRTVEPENTIEVIIGRPRLILLKEKPQRIQLGEGKTPVADLL